MSVLAAAGARRTVRLQCNTHQKRDIVVDEKLVHVLDLSLSTVEMYVWVRSGQVKSSKTLSLLLAGLINDNSTRRTRKKRKKKNDKETETRLTKRIRGWVTSTCHAVLTTVTVLLAVRVCTYIHVYPQSLRPPSLSRQIPPAWAGTYSKTGSSSSSFFFLPLKTPLLNVGRAVKTAAGGV